MMFSDLRCSLETRHRLSRRDSTDNAYHRLEVKLLKAGAPSTGDKAKVKLYTVTLTFLGKLSLQLWSPSIDLSHIDLHSIPVWFNTRLGTQLSCDHLRSHNTPDSHNKYWQQSGSPLTVCLPTPPPAWRVR